MVIHLDIVYVQFKVKLLGQSSQSPEEIKT